MAYTKEEHDNILKLIAESGEPTDSMLKAIQQLRDDYDERIGMENGGDLKKKYDELKAQYYERFFSGGKDEAEEKGGNVKAEHEEDVKKDGEKRSFEALFKDKED